MAGSSTATTIYLPTDLPWPVTITRFYVTPDTQVSRGTPLLDYSFQFQLPPKIKPPDPFDPPTKPKIEREKRYGTWESPLEGVLQRFGVRVGQKLNAVQARATVGATILEECTHNTQIHGMCAICGKDMTELDYSGYTYTSRATVRMTHDANGPTVSVEEAQRHERDTSMRLLMHEKLSLIVDLDQTIVHATVDPTVGEWMEEGEAFEAKRAQKNEKGKGKEKPSDGDDQLNPNWDALKDVKRFKLGGEAKHVTPDDGGMYYYIKPRPGLIEFLSAMKEKYEMHVYTMGTRAYALEVCKAIDPDRTVFSDRVLTRDESGSMTAKNLQRLFPSDHRMVVVIDDRSDVWSDVPNLVKVIPYDFFVGIGDINSAHLPKQPETPTSAAIIAAASPAPAPAPAPAPVPSNPTMRPAPRPPPTDPVVAGTMYGLRDTAMLPVEPIEVLQSTETQVLEDAQSKVMEAVLEKRPLAKAQEELDKTDEEPEPEEKELEQVEQPKEKHPHHHKALLHNNDHELVRIGNILSEVHRRFYEDEESLANSEMKPRARGDPNQGRDVRYIIQRIKREVLDGLHFTFSNVFPINADPSIHPFWKQAESFGAKCHRKWTDETTHVIALKLHSEKTDNGQKKPGVHVLHPDWLWHSMARWERLDEKPFVDQLLAIDAVERANLLSEVPRSQYAIAAGPTIPLPQPSPPPPPPPPTIVVSDSDNAIAEDEVDPEIDGADPIEFPIATVNWDDVDKEVDDFLNDGGDEDVDEDEEGYRSDSSMQSAAGSSTGLKRARSASPLSEGQGEGPSSSSSTVQWPIAKRKKIERSGLQNELLGDDDTVPWAKLDADAEEEDEDDKDDEDDEDDGDGDVKIAPADDDDDDDDDDEDGGTDASDESDFLGRDLADG